MVNFKSYYKTKLKNAVPPSRPPVPEAKLPPPLPKASSIKINTKAAQPLPSPRPTPVSNPTPPSDTIVAASVASRPANSNGVLAKPTIKSEFQAGVLAKRPRPEKGDGVPASKRPKVESQPSNLDKIPGAPPKKRRIVTLKTSNPKRLAVILGESKSASTASAIPGRTALPSAPSKEQNSFGLAKDTNAPKPPRKPLPSGDVVRKPLPTGGSSASLPGPTTSKIFAKHRPPMPGPKSQSHSKSPSKSPSKSATPPVPNQTAAPAAPAATAATAAAVAAAAVPTARPKIKIIRKPQPTQPPPS